MTAGSSPCSVSGCRRSSSARPVATSRSRSRKLPLGSVRRGRRSRSDGSLPSPLGATGSWRPRTRPRLIKNLNDGMSWGIYPLCFGSYGPRRRGDRSHQGRVPRGLGRPPDCPAGCSATGSAAKASLPAGCSSRPAGSGSRSSRRSYPAAGRRARGARDGHGLSHAARGHRRCRAPRLVGREQRRVPILA